MTLRLQHLPLLQTPSLTPTATCGCSSSSSYHSKRLIRCQTHDHYHHKTKTKTKTRTTLDAGLLFRQKVVYIEEHLNLDPTKALTLNPDIRSAPISTLQSAETSLLSLGIPFSDLRRIFGMFPILLTSSPHAYVYPVVEFLLNEANIPFPDLCKSISRCPRLLVSSVPLQLRPTLHFLRRLGFVGQRAISCRTTLLLVSSVEHTLIPKLDYIQSLGLSYEDAVQMVLRSPGLFTCSIPNSLRPKGDYFLRHIKGDIRELKEFPHYFRFSLDRKIRPRHHLLLEHGFSMRVADMLKVSDGEFRERLIDMQLQMLDETLSL